MDDKLTELNELFVNDQINRDEFFEHLKRFVPNKIERSMHIDDVARDKWMLERERSHTAMVNKCGDAIGGFNSET